MVQPSATTTAPGPTYVQLQPARRSSLGLSSPSMQHLSLLGSPFHFGLDYSSSPRSVSSDFTRAILGADDGVPPAQDDATGGTAGNGDDGNEGT